MLHQMEALQRAGITDITVATDGAVASHLRDLAGDAARDLRIGGSLESLAAKREPRSAEPLVIVGGATLLLADLTDLINEVSHGEPLAFGLSVKTAGREPTPLRNGGLLGVAVLGAPAVTALAGLEPDLDFTLSKLARLLHERAVPFVRDSGHRCLRIEDSTDLLEANEALLDGMAASLPAEPPARPGVTGPVSIAESAVLDYAAVRGPAVIGERASLADCYIGPYTSIGDDVTIESAEVERCVVCDGAVLREIGVRLEDSIVGTHATVTTDLRPPRALRITVGEDSDISLA